MIKSSGSLFLLFILVSGLCLVILPSITFSQTEHSAIEFTLDDENNQDKTITATIKNNLNASYYNFRFKRHNENEWNYYPIDPTSFSGYNTYDTYSNSVPYQASNSDYTTVTLPSEYFQNVPTGGEVDVQIQALIGDYKQVPYGCSAPSGPTYDYYFESTITDWNNTQTIVFEEDSSIPEFPSWIILPLFVTTTLAITIYKKRLRSSQFCASY
jgi:hypothetical protein